MTHHWDEFSKSLAEESLPRRESLRRLGFVLAGAVLSPLGLQTALAGHHSKQQDPCKFACRCRNKWAQNQCLSACGACLAEGTQLCGSCGYYYCSDLTDIQNCGACGNYCYAGRWEYSACIDGSCEYWCAEGAVYCDGTCRFLDRDFYNCGACGVVCEYGELCTAGKCAPADCGSGEWAYCPVVYPGPAPSCTNLLYDNYNCGACGHYCDICIDGECSFTPPPDDGGV